MSEAGALLHVAREHDRRQRKWRAQQALPAHSHRHDGKQQTGEQGNANGEEMVGEEGEEMMVAGQEEEEEEEDWAATADDAPRVDGGRVGGDGGSEAANAKKRLALRRLRARMAGLEEQLFRRSELRSRQHALANHLRLVPAQLQALYPTMSASSYVCDTWCQTWCSS